MTVSRFFRSLLGRDGAAGPAAELPARAIDLPPEEMHAKHRAFWGDAEIQEFWSGKSFLRPDEGNMLSYDLARVLVDYFAREWGQFKAFALAADRSDGGSGAARRHLPLQLGAAVCAVLERPAEPAWEPAPDSWEGEPEKGAF